MKNIFELATGKLSSLPSQVVHLDPIMKGKHFSVLSNANEDFFEQTASSILRDLMDENPEDLNLSEFYHVWLFVKIASIGSVLSVKATCPRTIRISDKDSGGNTVERTCGNPIEGSFSLLDADVLRCPSSYEIPTINLNLTGVETTYFIKPPKMLHEILLLSWFQESGFSKKDLVNIKNIESKKGAFRFSEHRMVLHLCDEKGNFLFTDHDLRSKAVTNLLENSSLPDIASLSRKVKEVNSYGVKNRSVTTTCSACMSKIEIALPLSAGLAF